MLLVFIAITFSYLLFFASSCCKEIRTVYHIYQSFSWDQYRTESNENDHQITSKKKARDRLRTAAIKNSHLGLWQPLIVSKVKFRNSSKFSEMYIYQKCLYCRVLLPKKNWLLMAAVD